METCHDKSLTVLLREYLDHRRSLNHSPLSCRVCRNNSRRFLDWLDETLEVTTVDRLRADHLRRWQSQLVEQTNRHGLPLKPRTVNKNIESVRTFIVWLVERGYVSSQLPLGLEYEKGSVLTIATRYLPAFAAYTRFCAWLRLPIARRSAIHAKDITVSFRSRTATLTFAASPFAIPFKSLSSKPFARSSSVMSC